MKNVPDARQRRNHRSDKERKKSQQCGCAARMPPPRFHRQRGNSGQDHAGAEQEPEKSRLHKGHMRPQAQAHKNTGRQDENAPAACGQRYSVGKPAADMGAEGKGRAVGGKAQAEDKRADAVKGLEKKGRCGNIGKHPRKGERFHEHKAHEQKISAHFSENAKTCKNALLHAVFVAQRFAQAQAERKQPHAKQGQKEKNSPPVHIFKQNAAQHRRNNGSHAVHGHQQAEKTGHFAPAIQIRGNGPRNDHAARSGQTLNAPQQNEDLDGGRKDQKHGGCGIGQQRKQQRPFAAPFVADRTKQQLPGGKTDHGRCQAELRHGRAGMKKFRQLRQCGQIQVNDKGAECRKCAQKKRQRKSSVYCGRHFLSRKGGKAAARQRSGTGMPRRTEAAEQTNPGSA